MTAPRLAYVAVVVRDVEAVSVTLETGFGIRRTDLELGDTGRVAPVFAIGETALLLLSTGDPFAGGEEKTGVHHIALGCQDPSASFAEVSATGIDVTGAAPEPGLAGGKRVMLPLDATVGVRTYLCHPLALDPPIRGLVERIDHIGVASTGNTDAIEAFSRRLGCPLESTQTDMEVRTSIESFTSDRYGVVYHSRPPEMVGGLGVAFITVGDCELEFLQDYDADRVGEASLGGSGSTRQDRSAIGRFIQSRGQGLHHVALKVRDIDSLLVALGQAGLRVIDSAGRPGSRRARIGFIHPESLGGFLVHLVERDAAWAREP